MRHPGGAPRPGRPAVRAGTERPVSGVVACYDAAPGPVGRAVLTYATPRVPAGHRDRPRRRTSTP